MPASIQSQIDTDLLTREAALISEMSGYEKTAQDLSAKSQWSNEDTKAWDELKLSLIHI